MKPRVALLRGAYLGLFEAQNYEPLLDRFDIRAYILPQNPFSLAGCRLPIEVCYFPDAWWGGRSLWNAWRTRIRKERYPMPGVVRIVAHSQLVHTFEAWYTYTQQAARACRRLGKPLVLTHWDTIPYSETVRGRDRAEITEALHSAAKIIATTPAAQVALLSERVEEEKIVVQGMGVDADRFSPGPRLQEIAARLGIRSDDFVFLFIGRLVPEKGIAQLLSAFRQVSEKRGERMRLLLVGSGSEEEWIDQQAKSWGLRDEILVAPPVSYHQVHEWHRMGDVFVFPSIPSATVQEQFGYALIEAMSTGRAVITTITGGIPEVVGDCARLVPPGDVDALAAAMLELRQDAGERSRLGKLARERVLGGYSTAVVSERIARIYQELLA